MGGVRAEFILSPFSGIHIPPYIRRDTVTYPAWPRLMIEIKLTVAEKRQKQSNEIVVDSVPVRYPLDYVYVQPEHIPAINSLCNNFFWPGIDCK